MSSPQGEPFLRLEGIGKNFGSFTALRDIRLEVPKGEFVCFLGPSGCGKTTLLRIIAGLEAQSAGRIRQGGRDISALPPAERDYGIVFQSYALFPNLSVFDNVAYGLVNRRAARSRRASASFSSWSACPEPPPSTRASSRAASSRGSRSRARSPLRRGCCCSTSRSRRWMPSCACA